MIYLSPNNKIVGKNGGRLYTPQNRVTSVWDGVWAADNAQYSQAVPIHQYMAWLKKVSHAADRCLFATSPDVVGDAVASLDYFRWFAWRIKALGFRVALVAQDGLESMHWPPEIDAIFIGGSTAWKMSSAALWCIRKAKERGAWVHVGRVNSAKRILHFKLAGVDSVDGTAIKFHPTERARQLEAGLAQIPLMRI